MSRRIALAILAIDRPLRSGSRESDLHAFRRHATWYQTFLVVVYPFRSPAHSPMKATEALALQCLAELLEQRGAKPEAALPNMAASMRIE